MKKLSLKGLAAFMTATAAHQRDILRQYKYPSDDDAKAKILYYREARDRVAAFHRSEYQKEWLTQKAEDIDTLASVSVGHTKARLKHNARGLRAYAKHFSGRNFKVLNDLNLGLQYGDVIITIYPDLHVEENGEEKIIKLEFSVEEPTKEMIKIVSQAMFEAFSSTRPGSPVSTVLYLDVPRGKEHRGAQLRARMTKNIKATCLTISNIWDAI